MNSEKRASKIWPLPVSVIASIVIFTAGFFISADGARMRRFQGIGSIGVGIIVFASAMLYLTYTSIPKERKGRLWMTLAIVLGETLVFTYAIMFLFLNLFGS